jgi:hypothetical protein
MRLMLPLASALLLLTGVGWGAETTGTKPKSPESIECSKQADAKGLHGQARKEFRAKCKKELKAKGAPKNP